MAAKRLGPYRKRLKKKAKRGDVGYPLATVAYYGPDADVATKVVVSIFVSEDADPEPLKKWFSDGELRGDETVNREILAFMEENGARSVVMMDRLIGCPHEEVIDYPEGEACPQCPYWKDRDRWTGEGIR